jgi:hypothetical protein
MHEGPSPAWASLNFDTGSFELFESFESFESFEPFESFAFYDCRS